MKFNLRSSILGGRVQGGGHHLNKELFTAVIPTSELVLSPQEPGDLIALWAITHVFRDVLGVTENMFDDFIYIDSIIAGSERRTFQHESPVPQLNFWSDLLHFFIDLELALMRGEEVHLAMDSDKAMVAVYAVDWFITRYRCRPPEIADGMPVEDEKFDAHGLAERDMIPESTPGNLNGLSESEKQAMSALKEFEDSGFDFLHNMGLMKRETPPEGSAAASAAAAAPVVPERTQSDDYFSYLTVRAAVSPDGFRDEDRKALKRFRNYVNLAATNVPPVRARWVEPTDMTLGQRLFSYFQILSVSSFPNADAARRRREELDADSERLRREENEKTSMKGSNFG